MIKRASIKLIEALFLCLIQSSKKWLNKCAFVLGIHKILRNHSRYARMKSIQKP